MAAACTSMLMATDLADELVARGLPFREAHHVTGALVRRCLDLGCELGELPSAELEALSPALAGGVPGLIDAHRSLAAKRSGAARRRTVCASSSRKLARRSRSEGAGPFGLVSPGRGKNLRHDACSSLAVLFDLGAPSSRLGRNGATRCLASSRATSASTPGRSSPRSRVSHGERFVGSMGSLVETLRLLARRCGGEPTADALELAAARRLELTSELLDADAGTLAALDDLRAAGLRLGLVSDSSVEVPTVWPDCPLARRFDATAFSCLLGLRKPAREMYLSVTRRLGVTPAQCLYVGDGDSRELAAAPWPSA